MTKYVALLRGINVGGNNIIKMVDLKAAFEAMGFSSVSTFIQSGNVIFATAETDIAKLENMIEKKLSTAFKYQARVMVRSAAQMQQIIKHIPTVFADPDWKHNVLFLSSALDDSHVTQRFQLKPGIEELHYAPGVLYWSAKKEGLTRSTMIKLASKPEYQEMTIRNQNTTRKLAALVSA